MHPQPSLAEWAATHSTFMRHACSSSAEAPGVAGLTTLAGKDGPSRHPITWIISPPPIHGCMPSRTSYLPHRKPMPAATPIHSMHRTLPQWLDTHTHTQTHTRCFQHNPQHNTQPAHATTATMGTCALHGCSTCIRHPTPAQCPAHRTRASTHLWAHTFCVTMPQSILPPAPAHLRACGALTGSSQAALWPPPACTQSQPVSGHHSHCKEAAGAALLLVCVCASPPCTGNTSWPPNKQQEEPAPSGSTPG